MSVTIEVEKKFKITEEALASLVAGAEFLGVKTFTDTCYDDVNYSLSTTDRWLRDRDGVFEYKIRFDAKDSSQMDRYYELYDAEIRRELKLDQNMPLAEAVAAAGYIACAKYTTTRKKYKKDGFGIDIDSMDFGYHIGEIELMVLEPEADEATARILTFTKSHGLQIQNVRGKLIEYICRYKPEHRAALKKAGFWSV